jgi:hypothetical protein
VRGWPARWRPTENLLQNSVARSEAAQSAAVVIVSAITELERSLIVEDVAQMPMKVGSRISSVSVAALRTRVHSVLSKTRS